MSRPTNSQNQPVTICLATYNGEHYLSELLDSILAQTHQNWTLLVSDDCSSDTTPQILEHYRQKHAGKIQIIEKDTPSGSASSNFFNLMCHCNSDYMMFCDQDDVWEPDKVEVTTERMIETERVTKGRPVLVHTDLEVVDGALKPVSTSFMRFSKLCADRCALNQLMIQNIVTGCTMMINKPLRDMALEAKNIENVLMHDWWLALIASAFGEIRYINKATIKYRQHGSNEVGAKNTRSLKYLINKVFKNNDMRKSLRDTSRQAKEFVEVFGCRLNDKQRVVAAGYAGLYQKGKLARLAFVARSGIWKYGLRRKVAQIIWG